MKSVIRDYRNCFDRPLQVGPWIAQMSLSKLFVSSFSLSMSPISEQENDQTHVLASLAVTLGMYVTTTRSSRYPRKRLTWTEHATLCVLDGSFRRMYRMSYATFMKLVDILSPLLSAHVSSRLRIDYRNQVAMTLRWLAGASYLDIAHLFGVSRSTFYYCRNRVVNAILRSNDVGNLTWPTTSTKLSENARGFRALSTSGFLDYCVGAIDGLFIRIKAPSQRESPNTKRFYSGHKCSYGLNLQAVCDHRLRILAASMNTPGGTNDYTAYSQSYISSLVEVLPAPYYIVGDAAYPNSRGILTPHVGSNIPKHEDVFNFYHSQIRITIERCFGVLVRRWGILWKPFEVNLRSTNLITQALLRLHNYCIDEDDPMTCSEITGDSAHGVPGDPTNVDCVDPFRPYPLAHRLPSGAIT